MSTADPVATLGLSIPLILVVAKVGGALASRVRQPPVVGELVAGVFLGTIPIPAFAAIRSDPNMDVLARLGALVLLFEVGLETTVRDVMRVGFTAARVAVLGAAGTLLAGWAAAAVAMPRSSTLVHFFLAAAMTATSIGVSARVLKESGASRGREAHTILGAAVLDDVLGLIVLATLGGSVAGSVGGKIPTPWSVGVLIAKTLGFLFAALFVGGQISPMLFRLTRGEVTLVFANIGLSLRLLDTSMYAALIAVVVLTTLVTPVALRWRLRSTGQWQDVR